MLAGRFWRKVDIRGKDECRIVYTHTVGKRTFKLFGCARRGCDKVNPDYLAYGSKSGRTYCLGHKPRQWSERIGLFLTIKEPAA